MSSILDLLKAIAPEASDKPDVFLQTLIDIAKPQVCISKNKKINNLAIAYLAAHMNSIGNRGGSGVGAVTSEREGDLARSFGVSGNVRDAALGQTPYGLEFLRLKNQFVLTPRTRNVKANGC